MRPEVTGVPSRLLLPVLVLVSLGVGLAVGEAVARHAYTGPVVIGAMVENDTELGFRLRRGSLARWTTREFDVSIAVDRDVGLRVGDVHDEVPVRPDIAFYGDSFVFGHGVAFEQTFTSVLARRYAGTTILNAGVYNYGPDQEYILAKRLRRRLQPTFEVATFFTGNDFQDFGRYRNLLITPDAVTIKAAADRGRARRMITSLPGYPILTRSYLFQWTRATLRGGPPRRTGAARSRRGPPRLRRGHPLGP